MRSGHFDTAICLEKAGRPIHFFGARETNVENHTSLSNQALTQAIGQIQRGRTGIATNNHSLCPQRAGKSPPNPVADFSVEINPQFTADIIGFETA